MEIIKFVERRMEPLKSGTEGKIKSCKRIARLVDICSWMTPQIQALTASLSSIPGTHLEEPKNQFLHILL